MSPPEELPDDDAQPERRRSDPFLTFERALAAAAMAAICAISFANVVVRYTTNFSFAFTEEYSVLLLVLMTFIGSSAAFAAGTHIRIGLLADRTRFGRLVLRPLALVASLAMFGLILYYGALLTRDQYAFEEVTAGLGNPSWLYTIWMPVVAGIIIVRLLVRAWASRGERP